MPEKAPSIYKWTVTHSPDPVTGPVTFDVDAAYSFIEVTGHMILKGADGGPVFTAEPGLGCTFTRGALVPAASAEAPPVPGPCPHGFPPTVRCHQCSPLTAPGDGMRL